MSKVRSDFEIVAGPHHYKTFLTLSLLKTRAGIYDLPAIGAHRRSLPQCQFDKQSMDLLAFRGTNFAIHLPISEDLLNKGAENTIQNPELDYLHLTCLGENRMAIKFTISPKIVITRTLEVYVQEDLGFPHSPRLHLTIERGLKVIDRMVIGFIKNRLPDWIQLQSKELHIGLGPIFAMSGMENYLPHIKTAKVEVQTGKVVINAAFKN